MGFFDDTSIKDQYIFMLDCKTSRRRYLSLHKKNKGWIKDIVDMGSDRDNSTLSWNKMAVSALFSDYKSKKDVVRIEEGILKERQKFWALSRDKALKDNPVKSILDFWEDTKSDGWYIPPLSALDPEEAILGERLAKGGKRPSIDRIRAWHYVLTELGIESISTSDPSIKYTDVWSVFNILLSSLVGDRVHLFSHIENALMLGYDPESFSLKIESVYGKRFGLKSPDPSHSLFREVYELVNGPIQGEYLAALSKCCFAFTCNGSRTNPILHYNTCQNHPMEALFLESVCHSRGIVDLSTILSVIEQERGAPEFSRTPSNFYNEIGDVAPVVVEDNEGNDQMLAYYKDMMAGALANMFQFHDDRTPNLLVYGNDDEPPDISDANLFGDDDDY